MTRAEQRLNSNHGRLMRAAAAVPERLRGAPVPGWRWTPRDMLAHVLAWQEEALRHLAQPDIPWPARADVDAWNAAAHQRLQDLAWDQVVARLEANHGELRTWLVVDPPRWFGPCTYWHYTAHTRALLAFLGSIAPAEFHRSPAGRNPDQSSTTTVAPIAAQS